MKEQMDYIEYASEIRVAPPVEFLKEAAYRKEEMSVGMTVSAQMFFQSARFLYMSKIDVEQGKREMLELKRTYEKEKQTEAKRYQTTQLWKRIEAAANAYAHDPSVENADKFYAAVYALPNDWRLKRKSTNQNERGGLL